MSQTSDRDLCGVRSQNFFSKLLVDNHDQVYYKVNNYNP